MSIIPKTTASMMTAASTAFGSSENSGASTIRVASTSATGDERGDRRSCPGGLVQRAGREAGRHRHALEDAGADVRHPLRHRFLVDVDPVPVPGRERPRVACGLREADQQQRHRGDHDHRRGCAGRCPSSGSIGAGRPRGTSPTSATPCAPRSKSADASSPPTTSTSAPGIGGAMNRSARITASATTPTSSVVQWMSPSACSPRPSSRQALSPSDGGAGQLRQLADDDVDRCAGEEPGHDRLGEELRDPAELEARRGAGTGRPVSSVIAATSCAASSPASPVTRTAPPATAASEELGPVEICRDVQKIGVDERARGRCVEAVLQRHAGDPRVAEVLRHDQRRDGDPGSDVAPQPAAVVARQPPTIGSKRLTVPTSSRRRRR